MPKDASDEEGDGSDGNASRQGTRVSKCSNSNSRFGKGGGDREEPGSDSGEDEGSSEDSEAEWVDISIKQSQEARK